MSLYDIIQNILDVSKNHNLVREVGEGDIYNYLNSSEHQYPCVFLTVSSINDDLNLRNVNCTLFYVDRLTSDESNKILVQSLGLSVLSDIVERIAGDVDTVEYTTFTEKFTDLCGGVYASLSIGYPLDGACSNDFEVRELEVTENGVYDVLGYDRIVVSVEGGGNQEEIEELEQELEAKREEINNLQIEVEEKTSQIQTLQAENESLNQQIAQKDGDISELESQIEENNSLIESLQQDVDNLNQQIVDMQASFEEQYNILLQENEDLHNQVVQKDGEIEGLNTQIESVTSLNVTENGTYIPEEGTLGWNNVDVNISYEKPVYVMGGDFFGGNAPKQRFFTYMSELPFDIDSSAVDDFDYLFGNCALNKIPSLNTSNGTSFTGTFNKCSFLNTIDGQLDLSKGEIFTSMFSGCGTLENIQFAGSVNKSIDFGDCQSLSLDSSKSILAACSNTTNTDSKTVIFNSNNLNIWEPDLETLQLINLCNTKGWTIGGNELYLVPPTQNFQGFTGDTIPYTYDFSQVTDFTNMFSYNSNIKYIYGINMDNATSMVDICHGCSNLEVFNGIRCNKTSELSTVGCEQMFWNCGKLHTINFLDISKTRSAFRAFTNCYELQNITFEESINGSTDFGSCTKLTYDSVKSILTACSNKVSEGARTLTFNISIADQNGELAELVAICNTKEWTINGLTLQ